MKLVKQIHRKEVFPKDHLTIDLIEALALKQDIEEVFCRHLEAAINLLLKHELTAFLDYEPYEQRCALR